MASTRKPVASLGRVVPNGPALAFLRLTALLICWPQSASGFQAQTCVPNVHRAPPASPLGAATAGGSTSTAGLRQADGEEGNASTSGVWHWRNGWEIHYECACGGRSGQGEEDAGGEEGGQKSRRERKQDQGRNQGRAPLLLLPGFGVGTFHFRRNMRELSKTRDVYAIDLLGQGKSWPTRAPTQEDQLCYSVDMWTEQVVGFIDQVIGEPAFVAGNSLGGFIGAHVAATHPRAVRGLALMNATPFWAFRKPSIKRSSAAANEKAADGGRRDSQTEGGGSGDWLGWDGVLPAPEGLFRFGAWYFDRMRDPRTVKTMLSAVYSNADAIGDEVVSEIIAATGRGPTNQDYGVGGHEAFTSIVFSPKVEMAFEDMIDKIDVPMALMYGKEDPWVVPLWGHRIKRQRPETLYYEISPSGHSPHHETPNTVNALLAGWLEHAGSGAPAPLSGEGEVLEMEESTGSRVTATMVPDATARGPVEWLDSAVWGATRRGR